MRLPRKARSILRVLFARGAGGLLGMGIAVLIANRLGASAPADAFFLIRRLTLGLTEAVRLLLVTVYVPPIVAMLRAKQRDSVGRSLGRHAMRILATATVLSVVIALLAPWVVTVMAPGFDAEREQLASVLLRILIFALPLHILLATLTSVLYAKRRFMAPELVAILPRFLTILVLFFLIPPLPVTALGWALLIGTLLGVVLVTPSVGFALRTGTFGDVPSTVMERVDGELPAGTAEMPKFGKRIVPVLVFNAYTQAASWIDFAFASTVMAGAVAIIEYGQRLAAVLPAMLVASFFTVFYTEMAHDAIDGGTRRLSRRVASSVRVGMFLTVPFALFLWVAAGLVVNLVYQHGAFDDETARLTTVVIWVSAPGFVIAFAVRALLLGGYADEDAPHLLIVAWMVGAGFITRITLLIVLPLFFGLAGIPAAVVVSAIIVWSTAYYHLARRWGGILQKSDLRGFGKIFAGAAIAGVGMYGVASAAHASTFLGQFAVVAAVAITGSVVYLAATSILGLEEALKLRAFLLRR